MKRVEVAKIKRAGRKVVYKAAILPTWSNQASVPSEPSKNTRFIYVFGCAGPLCCTQVFSSCCAQASRPVSSLAAEHWL